MFFGISDIIFNPNYIQTSENGFTIFSIFPIICELRDLPKNKIPGM